MRFSSFRCVLSLCSLLLVRQAAGEELAAAYNAGTAGNPAAAPSPGASGWTAGTPASDLGNFASTPASPDGATGFNAWRMLDDSSAASQFITWNMAFSAQQQADAAANGWRLSARLRVADPVAGNAGSNSIVLLFGNNAATRWILFFDLNAAGELVTSLAGGPALTLTGVDAAQHHVHELRYRAATQLADYYVDNVLKASGYAGTSGSFNGVQWGTGSSAGKGDGYWNAVEFTIGDPPPPPAPAITAHPASQSVAPGASVALTGAASGAGITFQWFKDAAPIPGANAATLALNNVTSADAGDYWLRATNPSGSAETRTAALEVRAGAGLVISEFLAENDHGLVDADGGQPDWIELHNPTGAPLDTSGLFLTDDPALPQKWALPAETIAPGAWRLVFASGKNRAVAGAELHANFALQNQTGYLALTGPGGIAISSFTYPGQFSDTSYGLTAHQPARARHFLTPTPGGANVDGISQVRPVPVFDVAGGMFSGTRTVAISSSMTGGTLRFTANGRVPQFDSTPYTAPIVLDASAHLRAAVIFPGERYGASATSAHLRLAADAAAFASPLPIVVLDNASAGVVPGVRGNGPNGDGSEVVEVPLQAQSLTILDAPDGDTTLTSPILTASRAGVKQRGSSSFGFNRKSYAIETWTELDETPRELSLLGMPAESDWVLYAPDPSQFDAPLIHNSLIYQLARESGFDAPRTRFVEVFLKTGGDDLTMADHRGLCLFIEKPKRAKGRINFDRLNADGTAGGWLLSIDRMDALPADTPPGSIAPRHFHTAGPDRILQTPDDNPRGFQGPNGGSGVTPGSDDMPNFYHSFFNFESPGGWKIAPAQRAPIQTFVRAFDAALYGPDYADPVNGYAPFINVENWAQHLVLHSFAKNQDAIVLSAYLKRETPEEPMEWAQIWDFDRAFNRNSSGGGSAPAAALSWAHDRLYYPRLMSDPEFAQAYIDQWQKMRRGAFSTANMLAVADAQVTEITSTVAARSGITAGAWAANVAALKTWLAGRGTAFDAQFVQPAGFSQNGGGVPAGYSLAISAPAGSIYYTTNGADPRAAGGGIAGTLYTGPIPIAASTTVFARVKSGSAWSGKTVATFFPPQDLQTLRVTEIHYNPPAAGAVDGDEFEFLELQNTGLVQLDLGGLSFSGIAFTFPAGTTLAPGAFFLLARNQTQLAARFPGVVADGIYTGKLDNNGETLALVQGTSVVWSFEYSDSGDWPTKADNGGMSLQRPDPAAIGNDAATWTAAAPTPGGALSLADSDGDGMPDYFEALHALSDAAGDADGDGAANLAEFNAGTNPRNPASVFRLSVGTSPTPGMLRMVFEALGGRGYTVQFVDALGAPWQRLVDIPPGEATRIESADIPAGLPRRFFRVITPIAAP